MVFRRPISSNPRVTHRASFGAGRNMTGVGSFSPSVGTSTTRGVSFNSRGSNQCGYVSGSQNRVSSTRSPVEILRSHNEDKGPGKGLDFWSALTGSGKSKNEKHQETGNGGRGKNDGMKIKFINTSKKMKNDMEVKYNSRKSKQRMEIYLNEGENKKMTKSAFRRYVSNEISKQMKDLSRNSSRFKKQQGFSQLPASRQRVIEKDIRSSGSVKRALRRAASSDFGGAKSSRRTITIGGK